MLVTLSVIVLFLIVCGTFSFDLEAIEFRNALLFNTRGQCNQGNAMNQSFPPMIVEFSWRDIKAYGMDAYGRNIMKMGHGATESTNVDDDVSLVQTSVQLKDFACARNGIISTGDYLFLVLRHLSGASSPLKKSNRIETDTLHRYQQPRNISDANISHLIAVGLHDIPFTLLALIAYPVWKWLKRRSIGKSFRRSQPGQVVHDDLKSIQDKISVIEKEVRTLRHMRGDELYHLSIQELQQTENHLEDSLREVRKHKDVQALIDQDRYLCVICRESERSMLLLPCRHLCLCQSCTNHSEVEVCPICRSEIREQIRIFA